MPETDRIEDDVTREETTSKKAKRAREELDREAAHRPDVSVAGLGAALTGEDHLLEERESTLSLKRAAATDGRV